MKKTPPARIAALSAFGLAAALMATAPAAIAQQPAPAKAQEPAAPPANAPAPAATPVPPQVQEEAAGAQEPVYERLQIGDATQSLLAWQRSGEITSATPRTIAGDVANRSYERYLKSFEFPIPERMTSSVKPSSGGGGGGGGAAPK
ncbi:MAG TPA: DUF3613 domain-containing protein [Variovorax sp.]